MQYMYLLFSCKALNYISHDMAVDVLKEALAKKGFDKKIMMPNSYMEFSNLLAHSR